MRSGVWEQMRRSWDYLSQGLTYNWSKKKGSSCFEVGAAQPCDDMAGYCLLTTLMQKYDNPIILEAFKILFNTKYQCYYYNVFIWQVLKQLAYEIF